DEIGRTTHSIRGNAVWLIHAPDWPRPDVNRGSGARGIIAITGIEAIHGLAVILESKAHQAGDLRGFDVDPGDRIVFLQRGPCSLRIGRYGDVLRLEILGDRCLWAEDSDARVQRTFIEGRE